MSAFKLLVVRLTGVITMCSGALAFFLVLNPATAQSTSRYAPVVAAVLLAVGVGLVLVRKWAAAILLASAAVAAGYIVWDWFRPDAVPLATAVNLLLIAVPAWGCLSAWPQLK